MQLWASCSLSLRLKAGKGTQGPLQGWKQAELQPAQSQDLMFYRELFLSALSSVRCSSELFVEQATSLAGLGLTRQFRVPECYLCFMKGPFKCSSTATFHIHLGQATTEGLEEDALDGSCRELGVTGCPWCTPGLLLLHGQGLGFSL